MTLLEQLTPTKRVASMDLVSEAGLDTSAWFWDMKGEKTLNPKANRLFCTDWSFGGYGEPIVVCFWHKNLVIENERVVFSGNARSEGKELWDKYRDFSLSNQARVSSRNRAYSADAFDKRIREAFLRGVGLRVILLKGSGSRVHFRRLDLETWSVDSYQVDGSFSLLRGGYDGLG